MLQVAALKLPGDLLPNDANIWQLKLSNVCQKSAVVNLICVRLIELTLNQLFCKLFKYIICFPNVLPQIPFVCYPKYHLYVD